MSRAVVVVVAALAAGCFSLHPVRPEQLPRVNGSYIETMSIPMVSAGGQLTSIEGIRSQSERTFDRPDGGTVTLKGRLGVDLTTTAGRRYRFDHPVVASVESDVLDLRSPSRSGRVPLGDVRAAEVREFDMKKTLLVSGGLGAVGVLLVAALLLSI
jgi:hypothetical protein